ncbi:MAG: CbiX/SirB N-terminal domain-containing protein [Rhodoplanes sp.]
MLLAAHGERRPGAGNEGVAQLAARLADLGMAAEVGFGFLKGEPSIGDAVRRLAARDLLVYPLFLSDGYFTQTLLPRRLEQAGALAGDRAVHILPPLGLDPALIGLILDRAQAVARAHGWVPARANLVLLAHGSSNNPASRRAAERVAGKIAALGVFARVRPAFLEEPPYLDQTVAHAPAVVVGLFAGEGLHGGGDAPQLVAELARSELAFAGNVGGFETLPEVIATAIRRGEQAIATSARPGVAGAAYVCR